MAILGEFVSEMLTMEKPRKRFAAMISGLDIRYDLGNDGADDDHPRLDPRMPDLDIVTADGPTRVFALLHDAQPVLLSFGGTGPLALPGSKCGIRKVEAGFDGICELPLVGAVEIRQAVLIRPDRYAGDLCQFSGRPWKAAESRWIAHRFKFPSVGWSGGNSCLGFLSRRSCLQAQRRNLTRPRPVLLK